ncbi:MAG: MBOAT family protein [Ruminococcaceae bacterium]|nr:MBOAT family protein [Oscillospiraceae bacterium]
MTFNSIEFIIFYPIVLLLNFITPHKYRWIPLLAMSLWFYMSYSAELIFLIVFTILASWICSLIIERSQSAFVRKLCLVITLVVCLGILAFFKYYNFLADSAAGIVGLISGTKPDFSLNLLLPVGISFYTFQTLSYAIDVYRGDVKTERHLGYYALFVTFFPQLVAGPIERPGNLMPQLKEPHRLNAADASKGAKKMLMGFFKKIVVADLAAVYVNAIYNDPENAPALGIVIATVLFAVQIYCDFSGYTDIAIGCARIMGYRLMQNFDRPYTARSIAEFWRRWHISLSSWFKDYLYFPLGGSRCPKAWMNYRNLMIVFLVSGLWHGANWTFVIWGFLHGAYQVVGKLTRKRRDALYDKMGVNREGKVYAWAQRITTFILVDFAWIFFRANSTSDMGILLRRLFTAWNIPPAEVFSHMGMTLVGGLTVVFAILIMNQMDSLVNHYDEPDGSGALVRRGVFVYLIWAILFAWMILLQSGSAGTFIYFQF